MGEPHGSHTAEVGSLRFRALRPDRGQPRRRPAVMDSGPFMRLSTSGSRYVYGPPSAGCASAACASSRGRAS